MRFGFERSVARCWVVILLAALVVRYCAVEGSFMGHTGDVLWVVGFYFMGWRVRDRYVEPSMTLLESHQDSITTMNRASEIDNQTIHIILGRLEKLEARERERQQRV